MKKVKKVEEVGSVEIPVVPISIATHKVYCVVCKKGWSTTDKDAKYCSPECKKSK